MTGTSVKLDQALQMLMQPRATQKGEIETLRRLLDRAENAVLANDDEGYKIALECMAWRCREWSK